MFFKKTSGPSQKVGKKNSDSVNFIKTVGYKPTKSIVQPPALPIEPARIKR